MLPPLAPGRSRREQIRARWAQGDDFGIVLVLILLSITLAATTSGPSGQLVSVALSGGTLLFVLHTAGAHRRTFRASAVIVTIAVVASALVLILGESVGAPAAGLVGVLLAVLAPLVILRRIIVSPTITLRTILGALAIYLLFGLAYAYLFPTIGYFTGTPFFIQTQSPNTADYLYFSYTTLATVGYGDFTAATSAGRMISVSEALIGQLYLVSAVALLVGNIGRNIRRGDAG